MPRLQNSISVSLYCDIWDMPVCLLLAGSSVWEKCKELSLWVKPIPGYPESLEQRAEALEALAGHKQF